MWIRPSQDKPGSPSPYKKMSWHPVSERCYWCPASETGKVQSIGSHHVSLSSSLNAFQAEPTLHIRYKGTCLLKKNWKVSGSGSVDAALSAAEEVCRPWTAQPCPTCYIHSAGSADQEGGNYRYFSPASTLDSHVAERTAWEKEDLLAAASQHPVGQG